MDWMTRPGLAEVGDGRVKAHILAAGLTGARCPGWDCPMVDLPDLEGQRRQGLLQPTCTCSTPN